MSVGTFVQGYGASRVYTIQWDDAATDSIASETFTAVEGDGALTITALSPSSATVRRFRAAGGTVGQRYRVRHVVTFTSGDIDSRSVVISVEER